MNRIKSRNIIDSLLAPDGTWCNDRDSLSALLKNHFQNIITSSSPTDNNSFLQYIPQCITTEDNQQLEAIPTEDEIHSAVMDNGAMDFTRKIWVPPGFYQTQWQIMKDDVFKLVKSFFHSRYLLKQLNNTRVSLIPKEIVQAMKRKEGVSGHLAHKMDMSKAFDSLEWSFLLDILKHFGFSEKFRQLIS
ncbi:uncharacterized protein LOC113291316 [Papaver somniferum]|uniref:uncharacterized protein LOC113291316 n=1 Tax=Papaver somniferum TaxID=3469 RepID=UPI000E705237|nr:uncharacterized protein LOC113291316 [Papaver somniferum]